METTVFLVRHAESDYNAENRIQGDCDKAKLTEKGLKQCEALKEILGKEKFDVFYSSPLRRAMETARLIKPDGLEIRTDKRLVERDFGELEDKTVDEFKKEWPGVYELYKKTKRLDGIRGAESSEHLKKRVWDAFTDIIKKNKGRRILIVTHGGFIVMVCAVILGVPLEDRSKKIKQKNANINIIEFDSENKKYKIIKMNYTSHLDSRSGGNFPLYPRYNHVGDCYGEG